MEGNKHEEMTRFLPEVSKYMKAFTCSFSLAEPWILHLASISRMASAILPFWVLFDSFS